MSETAVNGACLSICEQCKKPMRAGFHKRYCSDHCRLVAWAGRQAMLPLEPPAAPVQPLKVGPTTAQIQASQKAQTVKVLTMLQDAGPRGVSTGDFLGSYIGRFSARIGELRAVGWTITGKRESEHSWRFVLEGSDHV